MKRKRYLLGHDGDDSSAAMHPLNPYFNNKPDFSALAAKYPDLLEGFLVRRPPAHPSLDWTDPAAQRALTTALLRQDFGIGHFSLPEDKLCPPVPNRVNYVCWVQELLSTGSAHTPTDSGNSEGGPVTCAPSAPRVLDIGVGAACIYPLIGHHLFGWRCLGSDIDPSSVLSSRRILLENGLHRDVRVVRVEPSVQLQECLATYLDTESQTGKVTPTRTETETETETPSSSLMSCCPRGLQGPVLSALDEASLLPLKEGPAIDWSVTEDDDGVVLEAVMTNPPFYRPEEQVQASKHAACTGSRAEMHTVGGELAFAAAMVHDSLQMRKRVRWFSTMLGKRRSVRRLLGLLRREGVPTVRSTKLLQGAATVRWGLAWSFWEQAQEQEEGSKVFGRKRDSVDSVTLKDIKEISLDHMLQTSFEAEVRSASSAVQNLLKGNDGLSLPGEVANVEAVEILLRSGVYSHDTGAETTLGTDQSTGPSDTIFATAFSETAEYCCRSDGEAFARLRDVAFLCLSINRTRTLLAIQRREADREAGSGRWFSADVASVSAISGCNIILPLHTHSPDGPPPCQYSVQLSVLSSAGEGGEVRATLRAEGVGDQPLGSEER